MSQPRHFIKFGPRFCGKTAFLLQQRLVAPRDRF